MPLTEILGIIQETHGANWDKTTHRDGITTNRNSIKQKKKEKELWDEVVHKRLRDETNSVISFSWWLLIWREAKAATQARVEYLLITWLKENVTALKEKNYEFLISEKNKITL